MTTLLVSLPAGGPFAGINVKDVQVFFGFILFLPFCWAIYFLFSEIRKLPEPFPTIQRSVLQTIAAVFFITMFIIDITSFFWTKQQHTTIERHEELQNYPFPINNMDKDDTEYPSIPAIFRYSYGDEPMSIGGRSWLLPVGYVVVLCPVSKGWHCEPTWMDIGSSDETTHYNIRVQIPGRAHNTMFSIRKLSENDPAFISLFQNIRVLIRPCTPGVDRYNLADCTFHDGFMEPLILAEE